MAPASCRRPRSFPRKLVLCGAGVMVLGSSARLIGAVRSNPGQHAGSTQAVTLKTVTDDARAGDLVSLSTSRGAVLRGEDGSERKIPLEELVRLTTGVSVIAPSRSESSVTLTNGDVLIGRLRSGQEDYVTLETVDFGRVAVSLDLIERIGSPQANSASYRESVQWMNREPSSEEDRVLLTNGDKVRGFVTAIGDQGVAIETASGETTIASRLVVAVRMSPQPAVAPASPYFLVTVRNSGRLTATALEWVDGVVELQTVSSGTVEIEAERIVEVEVFGGRWVWLSSLHPIAYEHVPMLSLGFGYVTDRNVLGGRLSVGGKSYAHGLGVHSRASITYDLRRGYRQFVTFVGVDDDSGRLADVSVAIIVDGKRRYERTQLRRGELVGPIRLDVTNAQHIELLVDFGDNGDVQDRLDWIDAALVR